MQSVPSTSSNSALPLDPAEQKKVQKAARDFEAVFMRQLISSMRKASEVLADDSQGEADKMSMDMAWDGMADQIADAGGIGLAKMLEPWMAGNPDALRNLQNVLPQDQAPTLPMGVVGSKAAQAYGSNSPLKLDEPQLAALVNRASSETGVDSSLIRGVIQTESAGNTKARSPKGAVGLMQLMPGTAKELGVDPTDPAQNVMGGARYLASLLKRFDGDKKLALAGYNAGPGAVEKHGGIPPFAETRSYVDTVLAHAKRFAGESR